MNEHDLHGLARSRHAAIPDCRPLGDVIARGTRLRRRHAATRAAGATAMISGFAAASVLAVRDGPDTATRPTSPPTPESLLEPWRDGCGGYGEVLPADDVDSLRLIPTELPPGIELTTAVATRSVTDCVQTDPALVLWSADNGASVHVNGPYNTRPNLPETEPTTLRGVEALLHDYGTRGEAPQLYVVWTEADGSSWQLSSSGMDVATVRAIGEALLLDSTLTTEQSVAVLPADAMPGGYEVLWQAVGIPKVVRDVDQRRWSVTTTADSCGLYASDGNGDAPLTSVMPQLVRTTVRGHDAVGQDADKSSFLIWNEAPGVQFQLFCDVDLETLRDIAESLVPIEPDDPRVDVSTDVGPIDE